MIIGRSWPFSSLHKKAIVKRSIQKITEKHFLNRGNRNNTDGKGNSFNGDGDLAHHSHESWYLITLQRLKFLSKFTAIYKLFLRYQSTRLVLHQKICSNRVRNPLHLVKILLIWPDNGAYGSSLLQQLKWKYSGLSLDSSPAIFI